MITTDESFFCESLNKSIPELSDIDKTYKKKGLAFAEKQFADYVRTVLNPEKYFAFTNYSGGGRIALKGETYIDIGNRVCEGGIISVDTPHKYPSPKEIDWSYNPTFNGFGEWIWQIQRHSEWAILAHCYADTKDEKYTQAFIDYFTTWYEQMPCPEEAPPGGTIAWRSIEAGIRMMKAWHVAIHTFYKSPLVTDHIITSYFKSFCDHGYRLTTANGTGNWLIMEMVGLAYVGMLYPFLAKAEEWKNHAFSVLTREIVEQVYLDGFQFELTTGYHAGVVDNYALLFEGAIGLGYEIPETLRKYYARMYEMFTHLMLPDGKIPNLNDGGVYSTAKFCEKALKYYPEREDFRWFATKGTEGKEPDYVSCIMPYSGMGVMRTGWGEKDIAVFMDAGPFGYGHQHEDKLNVLLHAYGKYMMSDLGNYAYDGSQMRRHVIATKGHNCALVDGMGQNRAKTYVRGSDPLDKPADIKWHFTGEIDAIEGTYNQGFGPDLLDVKHNRKTVFFKKGLNDSLPFVMLVDRFEAPDDKNHEYTVSFQLGTEPFKLENGVFTNDFGDGVTMTMFSGSPASVIVAQRKPEYLGWRQACFNAPNYDFEHLHAPCVQFSAFGTKKRIVTIIYPSNNSEVAIKSVSYCDEYEDTAITLEFKNGSKIILDEDDYPCTSNNSVYFK